MTDYKQFCTELIDELENWVAYGDEVDIANAHVLIDRARAALAEPEPELPTDEELLQVFDTVCLSEGGTVDEIHLRGLRAVLARWGNHPGSPDSSLQPISVTERLPGPEDCNSDGDVWAWRRFDSEGDMDNGDFWCLAFCEWLEDEDCGFTHWLPAHALPLPPTPSH